MRNRCFGWPKPLSRQHASIPVNTLHAIYYKPFSKLSFAPPPTSSYLFSGAAHFAQRRPRYSNALCGGWLSTGCEMSVEILACWAARMKLRVEAQVASPVWCEHHQRTVDIIGCTVGLQRFEESVRLRRTIADMKLKLRLAPCVLCLLYSTQNDSTSS